jgi:hypothetical protein
MPMRMLVVTESYQNYQDGALSNQLTDTGRGGEYVGGDSEFIGSRYSQSCLYFRPAL